MSDKELVERLLDFDKVTVGDARDAALRIEALTAEVGELQEVFDSQWRANMRAVEMWRAANPGNDLVLPDSARLTVWMLERIEALTAKVKLMDDLDVINGEKIEALTEQLKTVLDREAATTARYDAKTDELEAKLATCEKYRDAYAECDKIGTQAVRDLEAKLAKAVEGLRYYVVEAMPWDADDSLIARTTLAEIEGNSNEETG
jgi:hypothetical protein